MATIYDSLRPIRTTSQLFVNPLGDWGPTPLYSSIPISPGNGAASCLPCVVCGVLSTQRLDLLESVVQQSASQVSGLLFGAVAIATLGVKTIPVDPPPPSPPTPPSPPA